MKLRITVEGKTYDVDVEVLPEGQGSTAPAGCGAACGSTSSVTRGSARSPPASPALAPADANGGQVVKAPIAGTIIDIKVSVGDAVGVNQVLVVMEAMKMETNIASPVVGKVAAIKVSPREAVKAGQVLVELE